MKKYLISILTMFTVMLVFSCEDAWDEHSKVADSTASETILEVLQQSTEYSNFLSALETTGLDDTLKQALMFTVWVPSNSVFTDLPDDEDELYQLVANHINRGSVKTSSVDDDSKVKMLSGKVLDVNSESIDGTVISKKDQFAKNGLIQFIEQPLSVKINIWEYIDSYETSNKQVEFINSLSGDYFDPEVADIVGYTDSGEAIYDTASGMVWKNLFLESVADLRVEDSTYTMLIIEDAAYDTEFEKFSPYFKVSAGSTEEDIALNKERCEYKITKDFVFTQEYDASNLPSQILSVDSILVPLNKSLITSSVKCSNGWVHHISSCTVPLENKILPIVVEGESVFRYYDNYTINGEDIIGTLEGYKRVRPSASGGFDFVLDNWSTSTVGSGLVLHAGEVASMKYKFYWKAIDDFDVSYKNPDPSDTLSQFIGYTTLISVNNEVYDFNPPIAKSNYIEVLDDSYDTAEEVEVWSYTFSSMRDIYLWLQAENTGSAVVADYIKLVPDFGN